MSPAPEYLDTTQFLLLKRRPHARAAIIRALLHRIARFAGPLIARLLG